MDKDIIISQSAGVSGKNINAICLGSGRFLRSVLVPFLASNQKPAVIQTRGRTFLDSFKVDGDGPSSLFYPVDTIQFNGSTTTDDVEIYAAGTMGTPSGKSQVMKLLSNTDCITVIGVGVTEAGLASADTQCMVDLTGMLYSMFVGVSPPERSILTPNGKVCIINTDNVPNNGDVIRDHILKNAKEKKYSIDEGGDEKFLDFVQNKVAFLNSMVDRITSSRAGSNGLVPLCEPLPNKALVICDPGGDLPSWMSDKDVQAQFGVGYDVCGLFASDLSLLCANNVKQILWTVDSHTFHFFSFMLCNHSGKNSPQCKGSSLRYCTQAAGCKRYSHCCCSCYGIAIVNQYRIT